MKREITIGATYKLLPLSKLEKGIDSESSPYDLNQLEVIKSNYEKIKDFKFIITETNGNYSQHEGKIEGLYGISNIFLGRRLCRVKKTEEEIIEIKNELLGKTFYFKNNGPGAGQGYSETFEDSSFNIHKEVLEILPAMSSKLDPIQLTTLLSGEELDLGFRISGSGRWTRTLKLYKESENIPSDYKW